MENYLFNKKNKAGYSLGHYLLSLQLVIAGHNMTYDEVIEMYGHKPYVDKDFIYHNEFRISSENHTKWFDIAVKEISKHLKVNKRMAIHEAFWLDFGEGLLVNH